MENDGQFVVDHKPDEVLVIYFWTSWCPPSHQSLIEGVDVQSKNYEKWKGKVRYLVINLDDKKEPAKKKTSNNKWSRLTNLFIQGWPDDHPLLKKFSIVCAPTVMIVNKDGIVDFIGHPDDADLANKVNTLITQSK